MALLNTVSFMPFKKLLPIYLFIIIVGILMVTRIHKLYFKPNKQFFQTELRGTVEEIYSLPEGNGCRIGEELYLIKGDCIGYIAIGDSIAKEMNSYYLKILEKGTDKIKYYREVEKVIFQQVESDLISRLRL